MLLTWGRGRSRWRRRGTRGRDDRWESWPTVEERQEMDRMVGTNEARLAIDIDADGSDGDLRTPRAPAEVARDVDLGRLGRIARRLAAIPVIVSAVGAFSGYCKGGRRSVKSQTRGGQR